MPTSSVHRGLAQRIGQSAYNRPTRVRLPHPQPQAIGSVAERRSPKPLTSVRFVHGLPYGGYPQTACGPVPKTAGRESVPWVRLPHPPLHGALAERKCSGLLIRRPFDDGPMVRVHHAPLYFPFVQRQDFGFWFRRSRFESSTGSSRCVSQAARQWPAKPRRLVRLQHASLDESSHPSRVAFFIPTHRDQRSMVAPTRARARDRRPTWPRASP